MILNPFVFAVAGSNLLLDESGLGSAMGAWSVSRKLRSAYAGNCIRVRESGGDTEANIGFSSNGLDTAALASHCGSNNGFIVTIYDQSGNGYDITQSTAGSQPKIVNAGSLLTGSNSKPTITTDGSDDFLSAATTDFGFANGDEWTAMASVLSTGAGTDGAGGTLAGSYLSGNGWLWYCYMEDGAEPTKGEYHQSNVAGTYSGTTWTNNNWRLAEYRRNSTDEYLVRDGTQVATFSKQTMTASAENFFVFTYGDGVGQCFYGKFHEFVIWPTALGSTALSTARLNINTFYTLY